jgi:hypothetical protein
MGTIVRYSHLVTQTTASLENYCNLFSAQFQYSNAGGYIEYTGLFFPKITYTMYDLWTASVV